MVAPYFACKIAFIVFLSAVEKACISWSMELLMRDCMSRFAFAVGSKKKAATGWSSNSEKRSSKSEETKELPVSRAPMCFAETLVFSASSSCESPHCLRRARRFCPNSFFTSISYKYKRLQPLLTPSETCVIAVKLLIKGLIFSLGMI